MVLTSPPTHDITDISTVAIDVTYRAIDIIYRTTENTKMASLECTYKSYHTNLKNELKYIGCMSDVFWNNCSRNKRYCKVFFHN